MSAGFLHYKVHIFPLVINKYSNTRLSIHHERVSFLKDISPERFCICILSTAESCYCIAPVYLSPPYASLAPSLDHWIIIFRKDLIAHSDWIPFISWPHRCVESTSEVIATEEKTIVGLLILLTAQWLTPMTTQSPSAWITSKGDALGKSANTFTLLHTCKPRSRLPNTRSTRLQQHRLQPLQLPWWVDIAVPSSSAVRTIMNNLSTTSSSSINLFVMFCWRYVCSGIPHTTSRSCPSQKWG